jgi:ribonuclease Z
MHLTLMGTSPAMASAEQDHIYLLLDGPAGFWLIDCGGSAAHQLLRRGYDPLQLRGIILTHGHADHIYGLPVFIQDLWLRGRRELLPIYANAPTVERCRKLLELFMSPSMHAFVQFLVISDAPLSHVLETEDFQVISSPTIHSFPCNALRFEPKNPSRVVVYSSDTAPCASVSELARGAALLLHEATVLEPVSIEIGHSTASEAATSAAEAGVSELWLVHTHPWLYRDGEAQLHDAEKVFSGVIHVAHDGDTLDF